MTISMIAALTENDRVIGKNNAVPWKIPEDMKHFRNTTMGRPVIAGRKTWDSFPEKYRPLPGRSNIIVTRDPNFTAEGASIVHSLDVALVLAGKFPGANEIFIIGGEQIYTEALSKADFLYLTLVHEKFEGDAFFPPYADTFTRVVHKEEHLDEKIPFTFLTLGR